MVERTATAELQKLATLVSASSEFMGVASPDGRVTYINEAGRRMIGVSPHYDVTRMTVLDIVAEAHHERAILEVMPTIARTGYWEGELLFVNTKTGALVPTYHWAYCLNDPMTGEQWAQAAVSVDLRPHRQLQGRFRSVFELAAIGLAMINLDGTIMEANETFASLLGTTPSELVDVDYRTLIIRETDLEKATRQRAELIAGERTSYSCELDLAFADGPPVPCRAWVSIVHSGDGVPTHTIAAIASLAEQQALEEAIRQQHKMEALGRMAGGIAHDFNNLLTPILGGAQLLARKLEERPEGWERELTLARLVEEAAERGKTLTAQLLALARQEAKQPPKLVDVNELVTGIEPILRRIAESEATLSCRLAPVPKVLINPHEIEQVLMNLVMNAHDALERRSGEISVTTNRRFVSTATPELSTGTYVCLSVADTGMGIQPDDLSKIFEPFFTTKAPGDGTGLGLMTVYAIVHAAGGTIHVDSEPGRGSTFTVYVPAVASIPD